MLFNFNKQINRPWFLLRWQSTKQLGAFTCWRALLHLIYAVHLMTQTSGFLNYRNAYDNVWLRIYLIQATLFEQFCSQTEVAIRNNGAETRSYAGKVCALSVMNMRSINVKLSWKDLWVESQRERMVKCDTCWNIFFRIRHSGWLNLAKQFVLIACVLLGWNFKVL